MRRTALLTLLLALPACAAAGLFSPTLPAHTQVRHDLAYGADPAQRIDVYSMPEQGGDAQPLIVMVHGGAWTTGDKDMKSVVEGKATHWVPRGNVFVSVNYRLLPAQDVSGQVDDVARALAFVQQHAREWGADPSRLTLMGHSAGAHLVALLSADPARAQAFGAQRWNATVSLDSAALDVESIMQRPHLPLYDRAFGGDPAAWRRLSPIQWLQAKSVPLLAVCSTQRPDHPCDQAGEYTRKAHALGVDGAVLPQDLDHRGINRKLGQEENYTAAVDRFIASHGRPGLDASPR